MPRFGLAAPDNWFERWFTLLGALPDVRWVETGFLAREQLPRLARRLRETKIGWGFHFPLIKEAGWPGLVEEGHSPAKRLALRRMIEEHFHLAGELGAAYANLHLPFYMRGVPDLDFRPILLEEAAWWSEIAEAAGLHVHLENARLRPGLFETATDYLELCRSNQRFRICLDFGHLLGQVVEGRFPPGGAAELARTLAPYTAAVHVYQFRAEDIVMHEGRAEVMRCPVVPDLEPDRGWADLPALLRPVVEANPDCLLILEHGYGQGLAALRAEIDWLGEKLETGREPHPLLLRSDSSSPPKQRAAEDGRPLSDAERGAKRP